MFRSQSKIPTIEFCHDRGRSGGPVTCRSASCSPALKATRSKLEAPVYCKDRARGQHAGGCVCAGWRSGGGRMREGVFSWRRDLRSSVGISQTRFQRTPPSPMTRFLGLGCQRLPPQQQLCGRRAAPLDSPKTLPWLPVAPERVSEAPGAGDRVSRVRKKTKNIPSTYPKFQAWGVLVG